MLNKYRVHEVAKDFKKNSKEITDILTKYATTPKNHMQVLDDRELSLIFECLTQNNQVESIESIYADVYREPKPAAKTEAPKGEAPKGGQQPQNQGRGGAPKGGQNGQNAPKGGPKPQGGGQAQPSQQDGPPRIRGRTSSRPPVPRAGFPRRRSWTPGRAET